MAYTTELTAKLTRASLAQLARFRKDRLLAPELQDGRSVLYSFRDVVALRSLMWLRGDTTPFRRFDAPSGISTWPTLISSTSPKSSS